MWKFILNLFGNNDSESQTLQSKIPLEKIEEMFANMHENGINTDQIMLWSYFFTSSKKDRFDQVVKELKSKNFEYVEILQAQDETYWLHLGRKEIHNAKSLYELEKEFYAIADRFEINYDGFDVDNVDKHEKTRPDIYFVPEKYKF